MGWPLKKYKVKYYHYNKPLFENTIKIEFKKLYKLKNFE